MVKFIVVRILQAIPTLFVIATLTFFMTRLAPGGPFDSEKRFSYFEECEKLLSEHAPILPIYFYVHVTLRSPTVKGWHPTLLDHHPYKYVRLQNEDANTW